MFFSSLIASITCPLYPQPSRITVPLIMPSSFVQFSLLQNSLCSLNYLVTFYADMCIFIPLCCGENQTKPASQATNQPTCDVWWLKRSIQCSPVPLPRTPIAGIKPDKEETLFILTTSPHYSTRNFISSRCIKQEKEIKDLQLWEKDKITSIFKKSPQRLLKLMNESSKVAECKTSIQMWYVLL